MPSSDLTAFAYLHCLQPTSLLSPDFTTQRDQVTDMMPHSTLTPREAVVFPDMRAQTSVFESRAHPSYTLQEIFDSEPFIYIQRRLASEGVQ
jgi:hypothetical protein